MTPPREKGDRPHLCEAPSGPFRPAPTGGWSGTAPFFPPKCGFTLVEALISISIAAMAGSILLLGVASSLQSASESLQQTVAAGVAQQLIDEVLGAKYCDDPSSGHQTSLGPSATEAAGTGRERFNDIDDYNGQRISPPKDIWGVEIGKDDGQGGQRHASFQAPAGFFRDWRAEIDVYYVAEADLSTRLPDNQPTDYRAVVVRILYDPPDRAARELVRSRRVVAYVQPM